MEVSLKQDIVENGLRLFGCLGIQNQTNYIYDNGNEFLGCGFQNILAKYEMKEVPTTVKNVQSNGIYEKIYQTMLNILKVYSKTTLIDGYHQAHHLMKYAISTYIHATRAAVNHTMQHTPDEIIFQNPE